MSSQFPTGTLTVNLIGCLIIGALAGLNNTHSLSENTRLLLFTGLLGGFTTFSSFSNETVQLLRTGHHLWAALYVVASNAGGFLLAAGGYALFKGAPNGG
jgi:CrcB protein